eukprot:Nk52_evm48s485 gene=Nk52_evmTU48s485
MASKVEVADFDQEDDILNVDASSPVDTKKSVVAVGERERGPSLKRRRECDSYGSGLISGEGDVNVLKQRKMQEKGVAECDDSDVNNNERVEGDAVEDDEESRGPESEMSSNFEHDDGAESPGSPVQACEEQWKGMVEGHGSASQSAAGGSGRDSRQKEEEIRMKKYKTGESNVKNSLKHPPQMKRKSGGGERTKNVKKADESMDGREAAAYAHGVKAMLKCVPEVGENFEIVRKLGEGTFSSVFEAYPKGGPVSARVALKHLYQTGIPVRTDNEVNFLTKIRNCRNVVSIFSGFCHDVSSVLVLPYFEHDSFKSYFTTLTLEGIKSYVRGLFIALQSIHGHHIIHRDIKPSNFLHNVKTQKYMLVDFGLAEEDERWATGKARDTKRSGGKHKCLKEGHGDKVKGKENDASRANFSREVDRAKHQKQSGKIPFASSNGTVQYKNALTMGTDEVVLGDNRPRIVASRAGTRGFRAPEVLLKSQHQTTAIDIWAAGVICLSLLTGKYPFFSPPSDDCALLELVQIYGTKKIKHVASFACNKDTVFSSDLRETSTDWGKLCTAMRNHTRRRKKMDKSFLSSKEPLSPECIDFISRALEANPKNRITAKEAIEHPWLAM